MKRLMRCSTKTKSRIIISFVELMTLLLVIIALIIPNKKYTISPENICDNSISLGPGRYIVNLEYVSDTDNIQVAVSSLLDNPKWYNGEIIANNYILKSAYTEHFFELWVTGIGQQITVNVDFITEEFSQINSLTVCQTRYIKWNILIAVILVITATYLAYSIKDKKYNIKKETAVTVVILSGLIVFLSFPLFTEYIYFGYDSKFHMIRVEGIKDGLLAGQFPVRIDPTFINGLGYAVPTYYGSLFFYFPAFLRLIGYDLQTSFKALLFLINCITVISSYKCFKEIGSDRKCGITGAVLYSASLYKFCNMYQRGAIGESIAMAVLPIIGMALWNIYTKPHDEKYKSRWILLTVGFTLVLHSHIISTEIFAVMAVIICLINFKKTFNKDTFVVLLKFVIAVCLINLGFIIPFIYGLLEFPMIINQWSSPNLGFQNTGIFLKDIFSVVIPKFWEQGIPDIGLCYYAGISLGIGTLVVFAVLFTKQLKDRKSRNIYLLLAALSLITVLISSNSFPWNKILLICVERLGRIGRLAANLFTKVQFAFRYVTLATFTLTCAVIFSIHLLHEKSRKAANIFVTIIIIAALAQCLVLEITNVKITSAFEYSISSIKDTDDMDNQFIIGEEYVPVSDNANMWDIVSIRGCVTNLDVANFKKSYNNISLNVNNTSDEYGWVEVPLLYYPGYEAVNTDTGEKIELVQSNTLRVAFQVPVSAQMNVKIYYKGKPLWIAADIISAITLLSFAVYKIMHIMHNKVGKEILIANEQNYFIK